MEHHAQFPDIPLPSGIYGPFGAQQFIKGLVGISPELNQVHRGADALASRTGSDGGDVTGDIF